MWQVIRDSAQFVFNKLLLKHRSSERWDSDIIVSLWEVVQTGARENI